MLQVTSYSPDIRSVVIFMESYLWIRCQHTGTPLQCFISERTPGAGRRFTGPMPAGL